MSASVIYKDRLIELLVQRATDGLNASEQVELNRLLGQAKYGDSDQFDQTASALLLAGMVEEDPLPTDLRDRLLLQADAFAAAATQPARAIPFERPVVISAEIPLLAPVIAKSAFNQNLAWIAAAACLVVAVASWWPRINGGAAQQSTEEVAALPTKSPLDLVKEDRSQLLAQESAITQAWQPTKDVAAAGVTGDVVWDQKTQKGYMRFRGLQANNPQQLQYQLWIFDATRGDRFPVDGGVFDIPAGNEEVLVPIDARLPIREAAMFAVTVEQPGGSVVSSRDRVVVLAQVVTS